MNMQLGNVPQHLFLGVASFTIISCAYFGVDSYTTISAQICMIIFFALNISIFLKQINDCFEAPAPSVTERGSCEWGCVEWKALL